jgi:hypothetical protein
MNSDFSALSGLGTMGCAVHSRLRAGDAYTTLELKVAYQRNDHMPGLHSLDTFHSVISP